MTLTNTGDAPLTGINATFTPSEFGVVSGCGSSLGAGLSCNFPVRFTPTVVDTLVGALSMASNAAGTSGGSCTVSPEATTTYTVTASNISGPGSAVQATVTLKNIDLTPILMLLLD